MSKLYIKQKILSDQTIQEILDEGDPVLLSGIYSSGKSGFNEKTRSSTCLPLLQEEWPDVINPMYELMCQFQPGIDPNQFRCQERIEYLKYDLNGKFTKHKDYLEAVDGKHKGPARWFSTTTLLGASKDLVGGDFKIWDESNTPHTIPMKVGETIMFRSDVDHEVTNINKGIRRSLVVWIHKI